MEEQKLQEEQKIEQKNEVPAASPVKKDRFLPVSILAAAVLISGSVVFAALYKTSAPSGQTANIGNNAVPPTPTVNAQNIMALGNRDAVLGNANAPVTIIEYGDYQCPFCAQFFSQTEPQIISNYVNSGKVKMVFRNFAFLGAESTAAAEAAECAEDQNQLWKYHDALYSAKIADDQKGGNENDGFFTRAVFIQLAQKTGLNVQAFTACIDGNAHAKTVQDEYTSAQASGVNSTPSFFINGASILGAQPYASFSQAITAALNK